MKEGRYYGGGGSGVVAPPTQKPKPPPVNIQSPSNPQQDQDTTTGSSDASGTGISGGFDITSLPFQFNPPMHDDLRFRVTDLGEGNKSPGTANAAFYDEPLNTYKDEWSVREGNSKTKFEGLRLGRIIMGTATVSAGVQEGGKRYGFRFLYNPASLTGSLNVGTDFIPDPRSELNVVLQDGLEQLTFEVLLNRIPDVIGNASTRDYTPNISSAALKRIKQQGTHYDVDYLYRVANGMHDTRWMKRTGNIGVLLANPSRLILGPYTSLGAVTGLSVTDQQFSGDMVPVLSTVQINFSRFLAMSGGDQDALVSMGYPRGDGTTTEESTDNNGSSSAPQGGGGTKLTGRKVYDLARSAGFPPGDADTMTKIAFKESGWRPRAFNGTASTEDLSYGLWQINMYDDLGPSRRKQYNLKSNTDLWDPATNARVARGIWKGQGFRAWSVYKNGSYREVVKDW